MSDDTVQVPKALLAEVLNTAESDNAECESQFAIYDAEHARYEASRAKIAELRRIAGIPEK